MSSAKTKQSFAAACHALSYGLPFLFLRPSLAAFVFIVVTHFVIDRWRLARYVVFAKNYLAPRSEWWHWSRCWVTGYPSDKPDWMAVWLLILADNTCHILLNGIAFAYL